MAKIWFNRPHNLKNEILYSFYGLTNKSNNCGFDGKVTLGLKNTCQDHIRPGKNCRDN